MVPRPSAARCHSAPQPRITDGEPNHDYCRPVTELADTWDARYRASRTDDAEAWVGSPVGFVAESLAALAPGTALDLGAGDGRHTLWLASQGWDVTAVDISAEGLLLTSERAAARGLGVHTIVADVLAADLPTADLVLVAYLHADDPAAVITTAAAAVRPGGHLCVVGHDVENVTRGVGGPKDPARCYSPEVLEAAVDGWEIVRSGRIERDLAVDPEKRSESAGRAIDTILLARKPA